MQGKDLNLDGTPKPPYRHPNFGIVTTVIADQGGKQNTIPPATTHQVAAPTTGNMINSRVPAPTQAQLDSRKGIPTVKPTKNEHP
jgi:hypothetical protein